MDYPINPAARAPFPWRTVTLVAVGVAAVELLLLIVVGGALLAKPTAEPKARAKAATVASAPAKKQKVAARERAPVVTAAAKPAPIAAAELPRKKVQVLVLNGNGRTGAAASAASAVTSRGYKVSAVTNAPRQDYPQSIVLFKRGFGGEAQRLAKDLGVKVVGPLDGMKASELHGAHVVYILGA